MITTKAQPGSLEEVIPPGSVGKKQHSIAGMARSYRSWFLA